MRIGLAGLALAAMVAGCGDSATAPMDGGDDGGGDAGPMDAGDMDAGETDAGEDDAGGGEDAGGEDAATDGGGDAATDAACDPEVSWEACTDGEDNDCDGDTDTDDGCSVCPPVGHDARAEEETGLCDDGIDNDCDGFVDCEDFDCFGDDEACPDETTDALCMDGEDNDGDGRIDCLGRDCTESADVTVCTADPTGSEDSEEACSNRLDDDDDGEVDCDDPDCEGIGYCAGDSENEADVDCTDGEDNDGDGHVDCRDIDCAEDEHCLGESDDDACTDGEDNDNDGRIDCADPDCYANPAVSVCFDADEICDNDEDDDFDGETDCFDPECESACSSMACSEDNPVGTCDGADEVCALGGVCALPLSTFDPASDDVMLITEIMPDPVSVNDSDGEFVEVLNISGSTVALEGLTLEDADGNTADITEATPLADGERVVFVADTDAANNGGISDGVHLGGVTLNQSGDTLTLSHDGSTIHEVTFPGSGNDLNNTGADVTAGESIQLDQAYLDDRASVTPMWCLTPTDEANRYNMDDGDSDYGTPGSANVTCP